MGITVAPLTTAVMGSVSSEQAGTASGVNNAVSRLAGGLTLAAFGAVALITFSGVLTPRVAAINGLPDAAKTSIQQNANKLGNTDIPAGLDSTTQEAVKQAIKLSFADMFRTVMDIGAGLAVLSAVASAILVENRLTNLKPAEA